MWLERHHRQHRVDAGEHARGDAGRELAENSALVKIVEARRIAHRTLLSASALPVLIRPITLCARSRLLDPESGGAVRFFIGMLAHETNTFSSIPTDRRQFEAHDLRYGGE